MGIGHKIVLHREWVKGKGFAYKCEVCNRRVIIDIKGVRKHAPQSKS